MHCLGLLLFAAIWDFVQNQPEGLDADEILVVKDGRIAERGAHQELVNLGGVYSELYETQFSKAPQTQGDGLRELEQYIWGQQPGDEPAE